MRGQRFACALCQVVGIACLLGLYVEKAEPRGAPNISQRDLTVGVDIAKATPRFPPAPAAVTGIMQTVLTAMRSFHAWHCL